MSYNQKGKKIRKIDIKIILLGESGVGKTSIINRYVTQSFNDSVSATLGAEYTTKEITLQNGKIYKLNIWDTAGSERFRSVNKFFYRDTSIAILVYDITKRASFEELKDYWINEVQNESDNDISKYILIFYIFIVIGIAGNKSDLALDHGEVSNNEASEFASNLGLQFKAVSARNSDSIDELFEDLVKLYDDQGKSKKAKVTYTLEDNKFDDKKSNSGCCE